MSQELEQTAIPVQEVSSQPQISFLDEVRGICSEYGLYGTVLLYHPSPIEGSRRNKMYLVASRNPDYTQEYPPASFDPEYYLRRNKRSDRLFYSDVFVYDLAEQSRLGAMEELLEYCKYTEFLTSLYDRYHLPPPDKLRRFELRLLMDARDKQRRVEMDSVWEHATEALNDFFSREQKGGHQKEWMDFFRSDMHPDDAGKLETMRAFRNRKDQRVSLEQLIAINGHINTLEMQEHEYRRFADFMSNAYPDVPYAVSKKIKIDNGSGPMDPELEATYGKRISGEQYARILEEQFAVRSWECIIGYRPTSFEVRKVHFIASDEPYIASAFKDATLRFARRDDLETVAQRGGEFCLHRIPSAPEEVFLNFVSLAKANGLVFYLDNLGQFEQPSLDYVNVIYSSRDEDLMFSILDRIVMEKVDNAHVVPDEERPALQDVIARAHLVESEPNDTFEQKEAIERD